MLKTMTLHLDAAAERTLQITLPPDLPPGPLEVVLVIGPGTPAGSPTNLAGRWQGYFPAEFDLDAALKEIRSEWEKEWDDDELQDSNT